MGESRKAPRFRRSQHSTKSQIQELEGSTVVGMLLQDSSYPRGLPVSEVHPNSFATPRIRDTKRAMKQAWHGLNQIWRQQLVEIGLCFGIRFLSSKQLGFPATQEGGSGNTFDAEGEGTHARTAIMSLCKLLDAKIRPVHVLLQVEVHLLFLPGESLRVLVHQIQQC